MSEDLAGVVETGAEEAVAPSIEETALAAFNEIEKRESGDGAAEAKPAAVAEGEKSTAAEEPKGPARGPDGKFTKAEEPAPEAATPPAATESTDQDAGKGEPEQASAPVVGHPPPGWSAAAKAEWAKLSPAIQEAVLKREDEVSNGFKQKSDEIRRYEPLEQVLGPRRQQFAMQGLNDAQAISQLFALSDFAARDLPGFIQYLANARGFDLNTLVAQPGEQGQQPAQIDPAIAALTQQVNGLTQFLTTQQQTQLQQEQTRINGEVESFRNEKSPDGRLLRPHFEAVRPQMAALVESGQAKDLQEAYDMAVYANPLTRQQILDDMRRQEEDKRKAEEAKRLADDRAKADAARKAAGTIIRPNGALPGNRTPAKSIEETAREAYDRINGAA